MRCHFLLSLFVLFVVVGSTFILTNEASSEGIDKTIYTVESIGPWGTNYGWKQKWGAVQNGFNVMGIVKTTDTVNGYCNPDYIIWVNETAGTYGISSGTGFSDSQANSSQLNRGRGGLGFGADGTIYYTFSGRGAGTASIDSDLFVSDAPYDISSFTKVVSDYETADGSASWSLVTNPFSNKVTLVYRRGGATTSPYAVWKQYEMGSWGSTTLDKEIYGPDTVDMEQVSVRYDPAQNKTIYGLAFLDHISSPSRFGTNPFLYTDDDGVTWKKVSGSTVSIPITYTTASSDPTIAPFDHIANGEDVLNNVQEYCFAPDGTPIMVVPRGDATQDPWYLYVYRWNGSTWESTNLTGRMPEDYPNTWDVSAWGTAGMYSIGATANHVVLAYTDKAHNNSLLMRASDDNGKTWSEPVTIDTIDGSYKITHVSFVQPATSYDGYARFFYYYTDYSQYSGDFYNGVKWCKVLAADIMDEGSIDYNISSSMDFGLQLPVNYTAPSNPPVANFTYTVDDLEVNFTDTSTDVDGYIVNWTWTLGDGNTSYLQNPVHMYADYGNYTVNLTVIDDDNSMSSKEQIIWLSSGSGDMVDSDTLPWYCFPASVAALAVFFPFLIFAYKKDKNGGKK